MADLLRTIILCGLISATEPFTLGGLALVMSGEKPRSNGLAFVAGTFAVQTLILLVAASVLGGHVEQESAAVDGIHVVRLAIGLALLVLGLRLRRPPKHPEPDVPKVFERLRHLTPRKAFVGGIVLADYQGPIVGSLALAGASVSLGNRLLALVPYTLLATGVPLLIVLTTTRSQGARERFTNGIDKLMRNRRQIASWICLLVGALVVVDTAITMATR